MDGFSWNLILAAGGIAVVHALLGPDHYLPLAALAGARGWSARRTAFVTSACGAAHVLSSLLLGALGVALGIGVARLEGAEGGRGALAAWALIAFGGAYALWGLRRGLRMRAGVRPHRHGDRLHVHSHGDGPHAHAPGEREAPATLWALMLIFVIGPCEPLIPLFVLPASRGRWGLASATALLFGVVTVATMVGAVMASRAGLRRLPAAGLSRWSHAAAGGIVATSGLAVLFLGL